MDISAAAAKLGIEEKYLRQRIRHGISAVTCGKTKYLAFRKELHHIEKGTVIFDNNEIIRGVPKIRRILYLKSGLTVKFPKGFHIEEKIDGYNVRVAKVGEEVYAITRGGLICPFSTDLATAKTASFFRENDLVLCGEIAGPLNPHVTHDYPEVKNAELFIFDIRQKESGKPVKFSEKRRLSETHGLKMVPYLGSFKPNELGKVYSLIKKLDGQNREGMVFKTEDMSEQAKYIFPRANISDVSSAFHFPFEYGHDFFFRRLIREGFQSYEFDRTQSERDARALRIGKAVLEPMLESINNVASGKRLTEDTTVEADPDVLAEFAEHLEHLGIDSEKEISGNRLTIRKRFISTQDRIKNFLNGEYASD
ncbi:MAG: RNA ligase [archaeon]